MGCKLLFDYLQLVSIVLKAAQEEENIDVPGKFFTAQPRSCKTKSGARYTLMGKLSIQL